MNLDVTKTEILQVDASPLLKVIESVRDEVEAAKQQTDQNQQTFEKLLASLSAVVKKQEESDQVIEGLKNSLENVSFGGTNPFEFILEVDEDGFADESWERIIKEGQKLQASYWDKSEKEWTDLQGESPSGKGWFGTFEMPKIVIKCIQPVYWFKDSARLPACFQIQSHAHMGSILRFTGKGDKVLIDDNGWWHQTNAPVGLYVEPSTFVDGRDYRNFEQAISGVTIVGQNGSMPIYISDNAFNFRLSNCNIQSHQGAVIPVKHGPALHADWYPVEQKPSGNNYLPDPIFENCLIEGVHKFDRRNAGICVSGNNIIFNGLNFYGVVTGIMSTGQGRTMSGCTMHHGATHNNRSWAIKDQLALGILSRRSHYNPDSISQESSFPIINPIKQTRSPIDFGWYKKGEVYI